MQLLRGRELVHQSIETMALPAHCSQETDPNLPYVQEMSTLSSFAARGRYTPLATMTMVSVGKAQLRGLEC